jgi:hypothetical protein
MDILAAASKAILFAIAPIATRMDDSFALRSEVISSLKKHSKLDTFNQGKIRCPHCKITVTFDNLGLIKESKDLTLTCDNPGCTLQS